MPYRVVEPDPLPSEKLPIVYLLHGGGADYRSFTNDSDVAAFAKDGYVFVMPEGESSYYTNFADDPANRFEDYIVDDLMPDAEKRLPVRTDRASRAIMGVSMGGYGAIKFGLKYPDRFAFVGAMSPAVDVPRRPFSWKRYSSSKYHEKIFGEPGSKTAQENDVYLLAEHVDVTKMPYFSVTVGDKEGLLTSVRQFAKILDQRKFPHEFHVNAGGHDWNQWNATLPAAFTALRAHSSKTVDAAQKPR